MKFHRHLLQSCSEALEAIFQENRHADKCIEFFLRKNKRWGSRDRRFFAETVYDCVRWYRYYSFLAGNESASSPQTLVDVSLWLRHSSLPEGSPLRAEELLRRQQQPMSLAVRQSFPDWWIQRLESELGGFGLDLIPFLNRPNSLVLRVNRQKISRDELIAKLKAENYLVEPLEGTQEGLIFSERESIFKSPLFQQGFFEVQDGSSQQVAHYAYGPGCERVIDACAGAGGKTLHLADLMNNKGRLLAMDIHQWKLDELKKRARRNSYHNIETRLLEGSKTVKRLKASADLLLLDVPCSGSGVLRRNPDTKWKITPDRIEELIKLQEQLLTDYSPMVKPGGVLLYSTCSLFPSENQDQIRRFLERSTEFVLEKQRSLYPVRDGYDGFYLARLVRKT